MLNQECAGFLFQVASQVDAKEHARLHGIERIQREKTNSSLNQASSDADGGMDLTDGRRWTAGLIDEIRPWRPDRNNVASSSKTSKMTFEN